MYKRGMTLVEVLVTASILVVVMMAVAAFQYNVVNYNRSTQIRLTNIQDATSILKIITRELRASTISGNGSYAINAAATSSITFFADIDSDGLPEQLRYYLAGNTMYRGLIKPVGSPAVYNPAQETLKIIATGIVNSAATPVFEYYTGTYTGTSTSMTYPLVLTSIRLIKTNITIDTDPNKSPVLRTFSTQAALRNLKDNL
jgi:prepilin-type N-terminal cleavage/methylation domain-containing protein